MKFFIKYNIYFILSALMAGILIKSYLGPAPSLSASAALIICILILRKRIFLFLIFLPVGILITPLYETDRFLDSLSDTKVDVYGTLTAIPQKRRYSTRLFISASEVEHNLKRYSIDQDMIAYKGQGPTGLKFGDLAVFRNVRVRAIENIKNPGSFDIRAHFGRKNIHYFFFADDRDISNYGKNEKVSSLMYEINLFRMNFVNFVRAKIKYPENEIINALTVGEKNNIDQSLRDRFSALGIAHIFAISGLHIGIVAFFFYIAIKWLLKRSEHLILRYQVPKVAAFLTIFPVVAYTLLTGLSVSSIRASIMIVLYLVSVLVDRDEFKLHTLGLVAVVILLFDPNSLFDLSFQLSFLSVFGILVFHSFYPFQTAGVKNKAISIFKTTLAATFITLPLVVNSFGYLPLFSIPANMILLPVVELLIVPLGLIAVFAFGISQHLAQNILVLDSYVIEFLLIITKFFEFKGFIYFTLAKFKTLDFVLIYLLALLILIQGRYGKTRYFIPPVFLVLIFPYNTFLNQYAEEKLHIYFLDSGNKNITVISNSGKWNVLISGGGWGKSNSDFIERSSVIPFLREKKITSLDYLILTSLANSNLNGAASISKNIKVHNIFTNGPKLNNRLWTAIYDKGIKHRKLSETEEMGNGPVKFRIKKQLLIAPVYSSKSPPPVSIEIDYRENKIVILDRIAGINENQLKMELYNTGVDILFLPELNRVYNYKSLLKNRLPEVLVCKSCRAKINNELNIRSVFDIESDGMVTVEIDGEGVETKRYLKK